MNSALQASKPCVLHEILGLMMVVDQGPGEGLQPLLAVESLGELIGFEGVSHNREDDTELEIGSLFLLSTLRTWM